MKKVIGLLFASGLLSACQLNRDGAVGSEKGSLYMPGAAGPELTVCTQELDALRQVSVPAWQIRNTELSSILTQEKVYRNVRDNISKGSVTIMDAAYTYKISRVCNDISNDLTHELVEKVEKAYQPRSNPPFTITGPN